MKFYTLLRKIAAVRSSFIIAIIGLFFSIGAVTAFFVEKSRSEWIETTATIQSVSANPEEDRYTVIVVYQDANGTEYTANLGSYSSNMKVGQSISIKYDKDNPESVSDANSEWMIYLCFGIGAVAFVGGTISTILAVKKSTRDYDDFDKVDPASYTQEQVRGVSDSLEGSNEYIYHIAGKLGYNYLMEDENKNKVYEARCNKIGFFTANQYTFINHLTHEEEKVEISHTVKTETETGNLGIDLSFHFNINGENCWKYLGRLGYSLDPHLDGLTKVIYDVKKYGVQVARITTAGLNSIPGAKQYPWGDLASNVVLKVDCRDSDIDGVAFACFCIAKK